ncbi:hypothetical protein Scep_015126 [Stephania cephalantha]|uniref:Uncharacterized protein n=1 Tax=Stephania cephalantha TaxID=152367 RepID=A0AAP0P2I2_9MAGN
MKGLLLFPCKFYTTTRGGGLEDLEAIERWEANGVNSEGDNKQAWRKFLDALQDKHEGPNFKGISSGPQASTSANGGLVCEPHRGMVAGEDTQSSPPKR